MLRKCVEHVPVQSIEREIAEYSEMLSLSSWKLPSLIIYILTKFPGSMVLNEPSERSSSPSPTLSEPSDTLEGVTTGDLTSPFAAGSSGPIRAGPPSETAANVTDTLQPAISPLPLAPQPTGINPPFRRIVGQQTRALALGGQPTTPEEITVAPPQPTAFVETIGELSYNPTGKTLRGTHSIQVAPTGQPVEAVDRRSPIRRRSIYLPNDPPMMQSIFVGQPGEPILDHYSTGITSNNPPLSIRPNDPTPYTYPVYATSFANDDAPNVALPPTFDIEELRFAYTRYA
ncbi:hypothetical protein FRC00_013232 [Tulasnella sp. 408]|nr:hypothetical protein FRC00_013232 [Tulasnella sp. 408]